VNAQTQAEPPLSSRVFDFATGDEDARLCRDIPDSQCRDQPVNFSLQIVSQALSKTGDALSDSKVVLPWLLGSVGAPVFFIGLLVPIRESLALLPQILVGGFIRRFAIRKGWWAASSLVQGICTLLMALCALGGLRGAPAGWTIIGLLIVFSLARGVASIAAKDTLGKTVSKGKRGRVSGFAATASGIAAGIIGLFLALAPPEARPDGLLYAMIGASGIAWFAAAATFIRIHEHPGATDGGRGLGDLIRDQVMLLAHDPELQKFLAARTLMIATAMLGPLYVTFAQQRIGGTLDNLGWLIIASGFAAAVSAAFWGALSDRSSRTTMVLAAAMAGLLGVVVLTLLQVAPDITGHTFFFAAALFILGIAHAGIRIGRKTHIVDLASGDRKAEYVALSNSIIGVLLAVLMEFGLEAAIGTLSVAALLGAAMALRLKDVQQ
jgi:hypothetical protein